MFPSIQADFDRLSHQLNLIEKAPENTEELSAMACQFLCVAIVGSLEQNLKLILIQYCIVYRQHHFSKAIDRLCQSFQNPKHHKIIDLISLFDKEFSDKKNVDWMVGDEPVSGVVNSMVGERIVISHQKNKNINVTPTKLRKYLKIYKSVIKEVHDHFLPAS